MTNEEAIKHLKEDIVECWEDTGIYVCDDEAIQVAISALAKQIQKKPIIEVDNRYLKNMYCGNCNGYFGIFGDIHIPSNSEYCPYCGQAIDWSDNDD